MADRRIIKIEPYSYTFIENNSVPIWGTVVHYTTRTGNPNQKWFDYTDELGAYIAFQHHCDKLDRAYARKKEHKQ